MSGRHCTIRHKPGDAECVGCYLDVGCVTCHRPVKAADRKYQGPCAECGAVTCPAHTWFYTDESNAAISAAARPKCVEHRGSQ